MKSPNALREFLSAQTHGRGAIRLIWIFAILLALIPVLFMLLRESNSQSSAPPEPVLYTVKKGDFIIKIAEKYNVAWESIVLMNETSLRENAERRCADKPETYKNNPHRRGHYCNTRVLDAHGQPLVYANTLQPGDVLKIPPKIAERDIRVALSRIHGNRIVVVIDDTGSMNDDRERVSAAYFEAIRGIGKQITRVLVFSEDQVRELDIEHPVFYTMGNHENTRAAIERAQAFDPDAIVLVTDEPGDDWGDLSTLRSVRVIAHSLNPMADEMLRRVSNQTGGAFLESHSGEFNLVAGH